MKINRFLFVATMLTFASTQVAWAWTFPSRVEENNSPETDFILENRGNQADIQHKHTPEQPFSNAPVGRGTAIDPVDDDHTGDVQKSKKDKREFVVEFELPTFSSYHQGYQPYGYNNYGGYNTGYGLGYGTDYGHDHDHDGHHHHHHHHSHHSHHSHY